jgi:chromosomal replication initiation ATPase DnaA
MMALHSCDGPIARRLTSTRVADVINVAARVWDVEPRQLLSERLITCFAHPRLAVYWIATRVLERSGPQVGEIVGRDASSVWSGATRADQLLRTNFTFRVLLLSVLTALDLPSDQVPTRIIPDPRPSRGVN